MPSNTGNGTGARRDGDALVLEGALTRNAVATLWPRALALLAGTRVIDLAAVGEVDSAGLALAAELAARAGGAEVRGTPAGLQELRAAYRLSPALAYAAA